MLNKGQTATPNGDDIGKILRYDPSSLRFGSYDPDSPAVYLEVERAIASVLPKVPIEHIGSSAVAGTPGKNVIDIAVSVRDEKKDETISALLKAGFQLSGLSATHAPALVGAILFDEKTFGIHVFIHEADSKAHLTAIFLREYLRTHPWTAKRYGDIKNSAAERAAEEYDLTKVKFIKTMVKKAEKKKTDELAKLATG